MQSPFRRISLGLETKKGARQSQLERDPVIEACKKDIDRTLIRENLRLSVQKRIEQLTRFLEFAEELRRAGQKQRRQVD